MYFKKISLTAFLAFAFIFCDAQKSILKKGIWHAIIMRTDSNNINFNFYTEVKNNKQVLTIINADERLLVDDITQAADSLFINLPFFSSGIHAKIISEQVLQGVYIKKFADRQQEIPFHATFG